MEENTVQEKAIETVDTEEMLNVVSKVFRYLIDFDRYVIPLEKAETKLCVVVLEKELKKDPNAEKILEFLHFKNEGVYTKFNDKAYLFSISWKNAVTLYKIAKPFAELDDELKSIRYKGKK